MFIVGTIPINGKMCVGGGHQWNIFLKNAVLTFKIMPSNRKSARSTLSQFYHWKCEFFVPFCRKKNLNVIFETETKHIFEYQNYLLKVKKIFKRKMIYRRPAHLWGLKKRKIIKISWFIKFLDKNMQKKK